MFCCVRCSFTTANRSHLTEHEQTHWSDQRTCELCHRNYKTLKSLINHTRKYHAQSSAGVNCLARLQVSVVTVQLLLHRCLLFRCNYIYIYTYIYFTPEELQHISNVTNFVVIWWTIMVDCDLSWLQLSGFIGSCSSAELNVPYRPRPHNCHMCDIILSYTWQFVDFDLQPTDLWVTLCRLWCRLTHLV